MMSEESKSVQDLSVSQMSDNIDVKLLFQEFKKDKEQYQEKYYEEIKKKTRNSNSTF